MIDYKERLGSGLKFQRNLHGKTQEEIADYLKMDTKSYQSAENKRRGLSLNRLILLCELYKITLNDLIDLSDLNDDNAKRDTIIKGIQSDLVKLPISQLANIKQLTGSCDE